MGQCWIVCFIVLEMLRRVVIYSVYYFVISAFCCLLGFIVCVFFVCFKDRGVAVSYRRIMYIMYSFDSKRVK